MAAVANERRADWNFTIALLERGRAAPHSRRVGVGLGSAARLGGRPVSVVKRARQRNWRSCRRGTPGAAKRLRCGASRRRAVPIDVAAGAPEDC
jgi:hypothetical protein